DFHVTGVQTCALPIYSLSSDAPLERVVTPRSASPNEESIERALRPKLLQEYVGQQRVREQLEIFIAASKKRNESLDHVLLFGPQIGRASCRERVEIQV